MLVIRVAVMIVIMHFAAIIARGEVGRAARGEDLGLRHPFLAINASGKGEIAANPENIVMRPCRDLREMPDAEPVQSALVLRADAADALEIVGPV